MGSWFSINNNSFFIILGNNAWVKEKDILDTHIGTLEPFTESLPSVLVYTTIGTAEVWFTASQSKERFG